MCGSLPSLRPSGKQFARHRFEPGRVPAKIHVGEHDLLFKPTTRLLQMKRISLAVLSMLSVILYSAAQAPDSKNDAEQVLALTKEVQSQQAQIVANQKKIEAKLAEVAEAVRVARIFSSRGR